jgi:hypothetical protein
MVMNLQNLESDGRITRQTTISQGENAELQHEQAVEKLELDWLKTNKIQ